MFDDMGRQSISAEIRCDHTRMRCTEVQAILRASEDYGASLRPDFQEWTIKTWDAVELTSAPVDFPCTRYVLRINMVQTAAVVLNPKER